MIGVYNNNLYYVHKAKDGYHAATDFESKTDESFVEKWNKTCFYKVIELSELDALYDISFWVKYEDNSPTNRANTFEWNVSEEYVREPDHNLEKGEVGLIIAGQSRSDDWKQDGRDFCFKVVKLDDCEKIWVEYKYYLKSGKEYTRDNPLIEKVELPKEEFVSLMLSVRRENI